MALHRHQVTPRGGKVQVVLQRVNSHLELSVADTGCGVKAEFMPHLFERFRPSDSSTTRRHSGLGLGLSIVKSLVELHGGSVTAMSPGEDQGTTVPVHLPETVVYQPEDEGRTHPSSRPVSPPDFVSIELAGLTGLVVDDQPDARELILHVLEDCSAHVLTAFARSEDRTRALRPGSWCTCRSRWIRPSSWPRWLPWRDASHSRIERLPASAFGFRASAAPGVGASGGSAFGCAV